METCLVFARNSDSLLNVKWYFDLVNKIDTSITTRTLNAYSTSPSYGAPGFTVMSIESAKQENSERK